MSTRIAGLCLTQFLRGCVQLHPRRGRPSQTTIQDVVQFAFHSNYLSAPGNSQFRSRFGRSWPRSGQHFIEIGQLWPKLPTLVELGPDLVKVSPNSAEFDPSWPTSTKLGHHLANNGRTWPEFGRHLPRLVNMDPNLTNIGPNLAEVFQSRPTFGQILSIFDPRISIANRLH